MVKTDKDFYDRKIVYLDYLERGEKVKNGGFVKWEARGGTSRIQIHIRGLYSTDTLRGEIQLISRQDVHTADNVKIDFGSGEYVAVWKNEDLAGTAVSYEECDGVQIKLSENRLLIGQWRKREALQESKVPETENRAEEAKEVDDDITESAEITEASETFAEAEEGTAEKESMSEASAAAEAEELESKSVLEATAETEAEGLESKSVPGASAAAGAEEPEGESVPEASAEMEAGAEEPKSESVPEVQARAEGETAEPKAMLEASAAMEEREQEPKAMPEASVKVWEKQPKKESVPETSARAEGGTAQRKSALEMLAGMNRGEPARRKEAKSPEKKSRQNPQCRDLLSGDKWEQLNKQYPHIHPFGDAREYLSITPRDFVILSRKYQELVQNSFLLHGYYNYGHVILTRIKEKNGERFYLGVPGVYYTREKQAALMFGFEGFEAGTERAVDGGFGYYMKQVDI
ncbi:MAG: hypothetical protein K2I22_14265 [Lachnospiraceae bacterium]|nr:hypothetical protein [Lachnospiraceae bacterium]